LKLYKNAEVFGTYDTRQSSKNNSYRLVTWHCRHARKQQIFHPALCDFNSVLRASRSVAIYSTLVYIPFNPSPVFQQQHNQNEWEYQRAYQRSSPFSSFTGGGCRRLLLARKRRSYRLRW